MKKRLAEARDAASTLDEQRRTALTEMRASMRAIRQLSDTLAGLRQQPSSADPRQARDRGALALAERYGLSLRELEVALLLADGRSNVEIAAAVKVSTHTARHHTQHVLGKLGVRSRSRAAALISDFFGNARG
ncbi:MAG TPA: helix-turn-helix transcriptional regulator [Gemmatimonadales bacterium]|nr:helix-turn-helix transcriptional regulator [Gemmatimonadales bacterium]